MMPGPQPLIFTLMGVTSMLLQITVLRLLLSAFSGNELDIGITLSFWLIYVGLGSYAGKKLSFRHAFWISFALIAILSLPTTVAIKSLRVLLSLEPGEAVSFIDTVSSTGVVLFPLCFIIGTQFPLAVSFAGNGNPAGRVYGLEALGAFAGGMLFTFVIASRVSTAELCLVLSLIYMGVAVYLSRKSIVLLLCLIPLFTYLRFHDTPPSFSWHGAEISQTGESRLGEIAVIRVGNQSSIYANGQIVFSYPDVQSEEMGTHLPMTMHPSPREILVIGGSPGILKELLKYHVDRVDFVELDPMVIDFSLNLLNTPEDEKAVKDPRVHLINQDGRRFIKSAGDRFYDLIILNLPPPSTASINRYFTIDFFREAKIRLRQGGVLSLHIPQSAGYIGKAMQMAGGSIYNSLHAVFRYTAVTSQEYGMIFSSDADIVNDSDTLEARFSKRNLPVTYFHRNIFRDAFSPFGVVYVKERLGNTTTLNTDFRPAAYLFNLMLWSEIHGGYLYHHMPGIKAMHLYIAMLLILAFLSLPLFTQRSRVVSFSVFSTGFSGMSLVLIAILAFQSLHGYVYEMIGVLSASFMIGLWAGTSVTGSPRKPLRVLLFLDLSFLLLTAIPVLFFREDGILYGTVCIAGIICGGQFSSANASIAGKSAAGRLYALDLLGSFTGALTSSLIVVPLFGIPGALLLIAMIKVFSALMILTLKPFHANY
jgi:spermidine synthase